ncbi:riboflavin synthase [Alysiella crassa]|uniref:Riboflavin synthase n=1 Tax=Alysiella crassa TaxID=153491 RepID=A0A376BKG0_9NEIS|nr:riboflavin synthase [Alysiella crassa]UOP07610.1 riboflavin synthase [Alysiella crassa]SSY70166.1 Riboflavin synthase alpha chain [Alysiella crassa]
MFTGIVQGVATVVAVEQPTADFRRHTIELPEHIAHSLQIGASVAHNGCCLTITEIDGRRVSFDLMAETLAKTNLGSLKVGDGVNVERAARFGDEIGGHVMSGHVMTTTPIVRVERSELNHTIWFRLPENLQDFVLEKGFIGLDGCSLTIGTVRDGEFCVHLIPETLRQTLFAQRDVGDVVNVEIDSQTQAVVETVRRVLAQKSL